MDFCQLLHTAQKNDKNSSGNARYYSTKFEPPKKVQKQSKNLSDNIKKFLAKKEAEEHKKAEEAKKKKDELLALRTQDKKATRRVNVMLKRTKSANQSVIEDAVDNTHTAVTRAGPDQPDEDDYGYVSQEASAFYEKMMEKYSKMPEEPKFNMFKKKVSTNLSNTKDRVKAALEKEREEAMQPHKRKRKRKENEEQNDDEKEEDKLENNSEKKESTSSSSKPESKSKLKSRPAPPPLSFKDLLKIAEKKQFEPIVIEQKPKEEEKLLTKRQKKEQDREREWRERKEGKIPPVPKETEKGIKNGANKGVTNASISNSGETSRFDRSKLPEKGATRTSNESNDRIPSKQSKPSLASSSANSLKPSNESFKKPFPADRLSKPISQQKSEARLECRPAKHKAESSSSIKQSTPNGSLKSPSKSLDSRARLSKSIPNSSVPRDANAKKDPIPKKGAPMLSSKTNGISKPKEFPPRDLLPKMGKPKEFPPKDLKSKEFPPRDLKPKQVPRDIRETQRKPMVANRGRILDDDDEDEYDSELDDFIDDGPEEGDNYSNYIKEIFGYDKSRYRDLDDDVDNMESSFAQQMKEEVISTKLGIMEDLEDMKMEEEHNRRKALMKKKMMKR